MEREKKDTLFKIFHFPLSTFHFPVFVFLLIAGCVPATRLTLPSNPQAAISVGRVEYIPLVPYCESRQIRWKWDSVTRVVTLESASSKAKFLADSQVGMVNEERIQLREPLRVYEGIILFPASSISLLEPLKVPAARAPPTTAAPESRFLLKKIVLDPGHGGKDPGARGRLGTREKDVVLDVAHEVRQLLLQNGIQVVMTRERDHFVPLGRRAQIANKSQGDFFISIHANSSRERSAAGFEVYYLADSSHDEARSLAAAENATLNLDENSFADRSKALQAAIWDIIHNENRAESNELARSIATSAQTHAGVRNRGVKSAHFLVLKATTVPAILVEIGFLSNPAEEKKLRSKEYRQQLARAIARGILNYKTRYEKTEGFTR